MARGRKNPYGWQFGAFVLGLVFVISSCNKSDKTPKPAEPERPAVTRVAQEQPKMEQSRPAALYSAAAPASNQATVSTPPVGKSATTAKNGRSGASSKPRKKQTTRQGQKQTYGAGPCPCSRSLNCVGPRGGRYCITSGGNKRYR